MSDDITLIIHPDKNPPFKKLIEGTDCPSCGCAWFESNVYHIRAPDYNKCARCGIWWKRIEGHVMIWPG